MGQRYYRTDLRRRCFSWTIPSDAEGRAFSMRSPKVPLWRAFAGATMVTVLVLALAAAVVARAGEPVFVHALLNDDGSGRLYVGSPSERWSWEACEPDLGDCVPAGEGWEISTDAAAGTVFRVSGGGRVGVAPLWHGNLMRVLPPGVRGRIRANELVIPEPGLWTGGWAGDFGRTQLAVCKTPDGRRCLTLTDPRYTPSCRDGGAVIDRAFVGDYLRVAETRYGPGTVFTLEGVVAPYGQQVWRESATTAAAIVGRIGRPARLQRAVGCGPPPLTRAALSRGGAAAVRCKLGCDAVLVAKRGPRRARVRRTIPYEGTLPSSSPPTRLRLPGPALQRLGYGRARMTVKIDGLLAANGQVSLKRRNKPGKRRAEPNSN
jgi:hypothetical protein